MGELSVIPMPTEAQRLRRQALRWLGRIRPVGKNSPLGPLARIDYQGAALMIDSGS